jgi:hypothetical protein
MITGYDFIEERLFSNWRALSKQLDPVTRSSVKKVRDIEARELWNKRKELQGLRSSQVKSVMGNSFLSNEEKALIFKGNRKQIEEGLKNGSNSFISSVEAYPYANRQKYRESLDLWRRVADKRASDAFELAKLV